MTWLTLGQGLSPRQCRRHPCARQDPSGSAQVSDCPLMGRTEDWLSMEAEPLPLCLLCHLWQISPPCITSPTTLLYHVRLVTVLAILLHHHLMIVRRGAQPFLQQRGWRCVTQQGWRDHRHREENITPGSDGSSPGSGSALSALTDHCVPTRSSQEQKKEASYFGKGAQLDFTKETPGFWNTDESDDTRQTSATYSITLQKALHVQVWNLKFQSQSELYMIWSMIFARLASPVFLRYTSATF